MQIYRAHNGTYAALFGRTYCRLWSGGTGCRLETALEGKWMSRKRMAVLGVLLFVAGAVPFGAFAYADLWPEEEVLIASQMLVSLVLAGVGCYLVLRGLGKKRRMVWGLVTFLVGAAAAPVVIYVFLLSIDYGVGIEDVRFLVVLSYLALSIPLWGVALMLLPKAPDRT